MMARKIRWPGNVDLNGGIDLPLDGSQDIILGSLGGNWQFVYLHQPVAIHDTGFGRRRIWQGKDYIKFLWISIQPDANPTKFPQ